jgi:hypothetical protein
VELFDSDGSYVGILGFSGKNFEMAINSIIINRSNVWVYLLVKIKLGTLIREKVSDNLILPPSRNISLLR